MGSIDDAHVFKKFRFFGTSLYDYTGIFITDIVQIMVAVFDKALSLSFKLINKVWTSRMRRVWLVESRHFIPLGRPLGRQSLEIGSTIMSITESTNTGPPSLQILAV